ncbi:carbohydrate ABC transporter permease [Antribacter sp. KLBMP9083]|uniref:Carbohydrate ABC transporter permease n=1 Tax=Antribacter soli TaxID=2910976 RepID=A0AA41QDR7_9MICO|nr:carbohydrate ABC transporter permease [Antribacter soli]MCF4121298.1 carbohydrate ABC transporter permease [Antribacter soli]
MTWWYARGRQRAVVVRYVLLLLVLAISVGPLLWQLFSSLKGSEEALFGSEATFLPQDPSLAAYRTVFEQVPMAQYIRNSLIMCALTIGSQVVFPTLAGYMLSRRHWRGRSGFYSLLIVSMMFPFESIMVSLYMQIRDMSLDNTFVGVWLPGAIAAVNVLIMRATFAAVPDEIEDAAMLDGADEWRRFFRLYLPAAKGSLVVVVINSFIAAWDDFLWPFIVLRSEELYTLSLGLARLAASSLSFDPRVIMAGSIIAIVPIMVLFIAVQRYFFKGVESGAIK